MTDIAVRAYVPADAHITRDIFDAAVTRTAAYDYSPEQIAAWTGTRDLGTWQRQRTAADTRVAVDAGAVVGFADVSASGFIDMMFVHPDAGRRGVGSTLLAALPEIDRAAEAVALSAHVSITARPFFAAHGFAVARERHPVVHGVRMTNYLMRRTLAQT